MILLLACAPDIRDLDGDGDLDVAATDPDETDEDDSDDTTSPTNTEPHTVVTADGDGWILVVDSTDGVTYVDLDAPGQSLPAEGWELSLERYFFRVNGGVSGDGAVEVAMLDGAVFEDVVEAPADGWVTDTEDALALGDWYVYDSAEHVMYAADIVWFVRNGEGTTWKVEFLSYYDDAGNTGFPSFRLEGLE